MSTPFVTRAAAMKKMIHHQFIPGMGYLDCGAPPDLPDGASGAKNCAPPAGTKDGTLHALQPLGAAPPISMIWIAAERAWVHPVPGRGNRMAWTAEHLSRAGWEYVGIPRTAKKRA